MLAAHNKIFYGWWNVATGFVGMGLSYAMFTNFVFGAFVLPLNAEFGWSRGELSFAYMMANIAIIIASPFLGMLIDYIFLSPFWVLAPCLKVIPVC
jgi:hypothetical protein